MPSSGATLPTTGTGQTLNTSAGFYTGSGSASQNRGAVEPAIGFARTRVSPLSLTAPRDHGSTPEARHLPVHGQTRGQRRRGPHEPRHPARHARPDHARAPAKPAAPSFMVIVGIVSPRGSGSVEDGEAGDGEDRLHPLITAGLTGAATPTRQIFNRHGDYGRPDCAAPCVSRAQARRRCELPTERGHPADARGPSSSVRIMWPVASVRRGLCVRRRPSALHPTARRS